MPKWTYEVEVDGCARPLHALNDRELAFALARTVLGYAASNPIRRQFAAVSQAELSLRIKANNGPLELIPDYRRVFRDFSGTSRIGELAQAITFDFFLTEGRFTHLVDFSGWMDLHGESPGKRKSPDFIILNAASRNRPIGVVESKGSLRGKISHQKGKRQGLSGKGILAAPPFNLPVHHIFSSVTAFHINGETGQPTIFRMIDPIDDESPANVGLYKTLIEASYSSFFSALGYQLPRIAKPGNILNKPLPSFSDLFLESDEIFPKRAILEHDIAYRFIPVLPGNSPIAQAWSQEQASGRSVEFFIRSDVAAFLAGRKKFDGIRWPDGNAIRLARNNGVSLYADGTALVFNETRRHI